MRFENEFAAEFDYRAARFIDGLQKHYAEVGTLTFLPAGSFRHDTGLAAQYSDCYRGLESTGGTIEKRRELEELAGKAKLSVGPDAALASAIEALLQACFAADIYEKFGPERGWRRMCGVE